MALSPREQRLDENLHTKPCPLCECVSSVVVRLLNDTRLLRCPACRFVYADVPDAEIHAANLAYGEGSAASYEESQSSLDRAWFRFVAERMVGARPNGRVLDVGCGNGLLLQEFIDRGWESHGVDVSPWSAAFAERYGFTLHRCLIEEDELPPGSFDVVTSTSTLEHIAQPRLHVRAIARILRPGGIAYFGGMPNYGSVAVRLGVSAFHSNTPPGHANYFTIESLRCLFRLLASDGYRGRLTVRSYGVPELHFWRARLARLLGGHGDRNAPRADSGAQRCDLRRGVRPAGSLVSLAVRAYYSAGRLFNLGEALEAVFVKDPPVQPRGAGLRVSYI